MKIFPYLCSVIKNKMNMKKKQTKKQFLDAFFQMICMECENNKIISLTPKKQKSMKGRKVGSGSVIVAGKVMTQQMYKDAAISTIKELTKGKKDVWVATSTIIEHASNKLQMDTRNANRKAADHPLYRIMSYLYEDNKVVRRTGARGKFEYRLA